MGEHVVRPGDCVYSLASQHGLHPDSIWEDSQNSALESQGRAPGLLAPRDRLSIREPAQRHEACSTASRHRFLRKGTQTTLRLRLIHNGEPRASKDYVLHVDGRELSGQTDADGMLTQSIPARASTATLVLTETSEMIPLALGHLDPVEEISGVQQRLANLGLYAAGVTGRLDDPTRTALAAYQERRRLAVTLEPDPDTRAALVEDHGS